MWGCQLKIVYGVDLHGNEVSFKEFVKVFRKLGADLMILGGDLNVDLKSLAELRGRVMIVPGECDDVYITKYAKKLDMLFDGIAVSVNNCRVGFVGSLSVHQSMRKFYERTKGSVDVLITHFPPKGCLDLVMGKYHGGLKELSSMVLEYKVRYVLTGHYHDEVGTCFLGSAVVINPGPLMLGNYLILNYDGLSADYTFMKLP